MARPLGRVHRRRVRLRPRDRPPRDLGPRPLPDRVDRLPARDRPRDHRAPRLPLGHGQLRLLAALGVGRPDDPRRPRRPRRDDLEGLLQGQHRSQGDRDPVHRHHVLLLLRGRLPGDADPRRAGPARHPDRRPGRLQRPLLDARGVDDLRVRHPGLRRDRQLRPAADDRGARHGVPAPERAQLLAAADRRLPLPRVLRGPRRRVRRRLDRLRAAYRRGLHWASRSSTSACSSPGRRR